MLFAYAYKVLVFLVSSTPGDTSLVVTTMNRLATDIGRESFNKVTVSIDYAGPYLTTPAALGCTGDSTRDHIKIRDYAAAQAQAAGIDLSRYAHFISWPSGSVSPGCLPAGQSGGIGWTTALGNDLGKTASAGMTFLPLGWSPPVPNIVAHEFTHGYGSALISVMPHVEALTCAGATAYPPYSQSPLINPSCVSGATPQEMDALGGRPPKDADWTFSTAVFNENAVYKDFFGWLAPDDVSKILITSPGTYTVDLYPSDAPSTSPGHSYAIKIPLGAPFNPTQSYYLEYRTEAHLGVAPGHAAVPGVYLYLNDTSAKGVPNTYLLKIGNDPNNLEGIRALALDAPVQLTTNASARVIDANASYARVVVTVTP
jgi:hypothetical protein